MSKASSIAMGIHDNRSLDRSTARMFMARVFALAALAGMLTLAAVPEARGVASFARQTGLPCSSCHTRRVP